MLFVIIFKWNQQFQMVWWTYEWEMILDNSHEITMGYDIFKQRGQDGRLGKTAKPWIIYLDL